MRHYPDWKRRTLLSRALSENMQLEQKVNILLVDDRPENLLALEAILESLGQNLVKASSGEEALRCLLKQDFAVILLDVQMPGIDGFETARLVRERERSRHTPIIFLTAFSTINTHVFRGYSLGAVDYLFKPIESEILSSKVAVFVDLWRKTAEVEQQAVQLAAVNAKLRESEKRLSQVNDELEVRVQKRTAELTKINESLQSEIAERHRVEGALRVSTEQLRASLIEKEVLLKEIHHRVKNNLQIISSLLNLQTDYIHDQRDLEIFKVSQNRIESMALIHEKLYQSKDLARIEFCEYIQDLVSSLVCSYEVNSSKVDLKVNIEQVLLGLDLAIPCGLIINELVLNSLKHAFPEGRSGEICIEFYVESDDRIALIISDNGIGFPQGIDFRNTESLGLQLVNSLMNQIGGTIELNATQGTEFKMKLPM